jgi:2-oxoglutarate dehydrogenase E1 component
MGAWSFVETYLEKALQKAGCGVQRPRYAGRRPAASPATGLMSRHLTEQQEFFDSALKG